MLIDVQSLHSGTSSAMACWTSSKTTGFNRPLIKSVCLSLLDANIDVLTKSRREVRFDGMNHHIGLRNNLSVFGFHDLVKASAELNTTLLVQFRDQLTSSTAFGKLRTVSGSLRISERKRGGSTTRVKSARSYLVPLVSNIDQLAVNFDFRIAVGHTIAGRDSVDRVFELLRGSEIHL